MTLNKRQALYTLASIATLIVLVYTTNVSRDHSPSGSGDTYLQGFDGERLPRPPRSTIDNTAHPYDEVRTVTAANSHLISHTYYWHEPSSIELIQEQGWDVAPDNQVKTLPGMGDVQFAFVKHGTVCTLAYAYFPDIELPMYEQYSFADRVMAPLNQLDSDWYVHKDHLPHQPFEFIGYKRIPTAYEARIMYVPKVGSVPYGKQPRFVLFDQDNGPVSSACNDEASAMLATTRVRYRQVHLDPISQGVLYFARQDSRTKLLLLADDTPGSIDVAEIGAGIIIVHHDTIYTLEDGHIKILDMYTGDSSPLMTAPLQNNETINTFNIAQGKIYYLVGSPTCNEYLAHCLQKVFSYDIQSHLNTLIAENLPARVINGYDSTNNTITMSWGDGDGGCFSTSYLVFDIDTGTTTDRNSISGCYLEEGDNTELNRQVQEFQKNRFKSNATSTTHILLDSGHLSLPPSSSRFPGFGEPIHFMY